MKRNHKIIVATMRDGNVQRIYRHNVSTAGGATRLLNSAEGQAQLWITRETAAALGGEAETFWGRFADETEYQIKSDDVMASA